MQVLEAVDQFCRKIDFLQNLSSESPLDHDFFNPRHESLNVCVYSWKMFTPTSYAPRHKTNQNLPSIHGCCQRSSGISLQGESQHYNLWREFSILLSFNKLLLQNCCCSKCRSYLASFCHFTFPGFSFRLSVRQVCLLIYLAAVPPSFFESCAQKYVVYRFSPSRSSKPPLTSVIRDHFNIHFLQNCRHG